MATWSLLTGSSDFNNFIAKTWKATITGTDSTDDLTDINPKVKHFVAVKSTADEFLTLTVGYGGGTPEEFVISTTAGTTGGIDFAKTIDEGVTLISLSGTSITSSVITVTEIIE